MEPNEWPDHHETPNRTVAFEAEILELASYPMPRHFGNSISAVSLSLSLFGHPSQASAARLRVERRSWLQNAASFYAPTN